MTAREMHIELDLRGQRMSSEAYDTFLVEEKDWVFNIAQLQLIKTRSTPLSNRRKEGFEDVVKRYDDLQSLLTRATLPTFVSENKTNEVYSYLPYNYLFFDKVITKTNSSCNNLVLNKVVANSLFTGKIGFPSFAAEPDPFDAITIQIKDYIGNWTTLFDIDNYPTFSATLTDSDLKFSLILSILEVINRNIDIKVRYQTIGNEYYQNKFIFETNKKEPNTNNPYYTEVRISGFLGTITEPITAISANKYTTASTVNVDNTPARLVKTTDVYEIQKHPFAKSVATSPIVTLENNTIRVYTNSNFFVDEIELLYIRKPRAINLHLEQDCELPESVHTEIVGIAAQLLAGFINSDTYKNIINENLLSE